METISIYRDLRPTLILLFCLGFDLFPRNKDAHIFIKSIRRLINILQYVFLALIWLNCVLYKIYFGVTTGLADINSLVTASSYLIVNVFTVFDIFAILFFIRMMYTSLFYSCL
jgi:hypothetical protein